VKNITDEQYEICFQKFNPIFKLKILKSASDTNGHQIRSIFDKFRKISKNTLK